MPRHVRTQPSTTTPVKPRRNAAFVFVKPHAVTDATIALVKEGLVSSGINIQAEGRISSEDIDSKKLIDQHYYAIASKATILKPNELNVPTDKFEAQFGLSWEAALAQGNVYNAMDACEKLGITADEMDAQWGICKKAKKLVKFGGGFYCGLIEMEGKPSLYVFNGFFMAMRSKFTQPGGSIYYFNVDWDPTELSWSDFRGKVLGPTDPAEAPAESLRGKVKAQWQALGLAAEPDVGDNGVHASASPFEALAERMNWCGASFEPGRDPCGFGIGMALLCAVRMDPKSIKAWTVDPQVSLPGGGKGSLFDALEDMDADPCIDKIRAIWAAEEAAAKEEAAKAAEEAAQAAEAADQAVEQMITEFEMVVTAGGAPPEIRRMLAKFDEMKGANEGVNKEQFKAILIDTLQFKIAQTIEEQGAALGAPTSKARLQELSASCVRHVGILFEGVFEVFDTNGDGVATKKEMATLASAISTADDQEGAAKKQFLGLLFSVLDADKSGAIDCAEVIEYAAKLSKAAASAVKAVAAFVFSQEVMTADGGPISEQIKDLFDHIDEDKSGTLTFDELIAPFVKAKGVAADKYESIDFDEQGDTYAMLAAWLQSFSTAKEEEQEEALIEQALKESLDEEGRVDPTVALLVEVKKAKDALIGKLTMKAMDPTGGLGCVTKAQFIKCAVPVLSPLLRIAVNTLTDGFVEKANLEEAKGAVKTTGKSVQSHLKPAGVVNFVGALFDLLDTDGSESLRLEEIANARVLFKGPGGPSMEERLHAFLGFFDEDGDGAMSKEEVKTVCGKAGNVALAFINLMVDAVTEAVLEDVVKPFLATAFKKIFPEGVTKEEVLRILHSKEVDGKAKAEAFVKAGLRAFPDPDTGLPHGDRPVELGAYTVSGSDGGMSWGSMRLTLDLKPDGEARLNDQDVADRDSHYESDWKGTYEVEGDVLTFFGTSVKSDSGYDYGKEYAPGKKVSKFKILEDGNLNEMKEDGSLVMSYRYGYGGSTDHHVLTNPKNNKA